MMRELRGCDIVRDQALDLVVAHHDRIVIAGDAELPIEQRMVINDPRLEVLLVARATESA